MIANDIVNIYFNDYPKVSNEQFKNLQLYFYNNDIHKIRTQEPIERLSNELRQITEFNSNNNITDCKPDILCKFIIFIIEHTDNFFLYKNLNRYLILLSDFPTILETLFNNIEEPPSLSDKEKNSIMFNAIYCMVKTKEKLFIALKNPFIQKFLNGHNLNLFSIALSKDCNLEAFQYLLDNGINIDTTHIKTIINTFKSELLEELEKRTTIKIDADIVKEFVTWSNFYLKRGSKRLDNIKKTSEIIFSHCNKEQLLNINDIIHPDIRMVYDKILLEKNIHKSALHNKVKI